MDVIINERGVIRCNSYSALHYLNTGCSTLIQSNNLSAQLFRHGDLNQTELRGFCPAINRRLARTFGLHGISPWMPGPLHLLPEPNNTCGER